MLVFFSFFCHSHKKGVVFSCLLSRILHGQYDKFMKWQNLDLTPFIFSFRFRMCTIFFYIFFTLSSVVVFLPFVLLPHTYAFYFRFLCQNARLNKAPEKVWTSLWKAVKNDSKLKNRKGWDFHQPWWLVLIFFNFTKKKIFFFLHFWTSKLLFYSISPSPSPISCFISFFYLIFLHSSLLRGVCV